MNIAHTKAYRGGAGGASIKSKSSNVIDISRPAALEEVRKDIELGFGVCLLPTANERNELYSVVKFIHEHGIEKLNALIKYAGDLNLEIEKYLS